jgi:hypothetical protein
MHSLTRTYKRRSARVIELWGSDRPGQDKEQRARKKAIKEEHENFAIEIFTFNFDTASPL